MFKTIIETAAALGADYVGYRSGPANSIVVVKVDTEEVVANTSRDGRDIFAAGVATRKQSFYDYDARQFTCGTVEQLVGSDS